MEYFQSKSHKSRSFDEIQDIEYKGDDIKSDPGVPKKIRLILVTGPQYCRTRSIALGIASWLRCPILSLETILEQQKEEAEANNKQLLIKKAFNILLNQAADLTQSITYTSNACIILHFCLYKDILSLSPVEELNLRFKRLRRQMDLVLVIECKPRGTEYLWRQLFDEQQSRTCRWYEATSWDDVKVEATILPKFDLYPCYFHVSKMEIDPFHDYTFVQSYNPNLNQQDSSCSFDSLSPSRYTKFPKNLDIPSVEYESNDADSHIDESDDDEDDGMFRQYESDDDEDDGMFRQYESDDDDDNDMEEYISNCSRNVNFGMSAAFVEALEYLLFDPYRTEHLISLRNWGEMRIQYLLYNDGPFIRNRSKSASCFLGTLPHYIITHNKMIRPDQKLGNCQVCGDLVDNTAGSSSYSCSFCPLDFHKACAELNGIMKWDPIPWRVTGFLYLRKFTGEEVHACESCGVEGYSGQCTSCIFRTIMKCHLLPMVIFNPITSDQLQLHIVTHNEIGLRMCAACGHPLVSPVTYYHNGRNLFYGLLCITLLFQQQIGKHFGYQHPLQLQFSPNEQYEDHICHACCMERDPQHWYYYCEECDYEAHLNCIRPVDRRCH